MYVTEIRIPTGLQILTNIDLGLEQGDSERGIRPRTCKTDASS